MMMVMMTMTMMMINDDNDDEFTGWSLRNLEGLRQNCWKLEFILKFVFGDSNVLAMMIMMSEPS